MLIVLAYHSGDAEQALRLAEWLLELGPQPNHDLLLFRHADAPIIPELHQIFRTASERVISDDTWNRWPDSANWAYRKAAKEIEYTTREAWCWIEPDIAVFRQSAFDEIHREYGATLAKGKYFLGALKATTDIPPRAKMSGVGIYCGNLSERAGQVFQAFDTPWDVIAADQIVPQMQESELFVDAWKHPPFTSWAEVEEKILSRKPKCAIFHSDKSGSLIQLLRERKNFSGSTDGRAQEVPGPGMGSPVALDNAKNEPPRDLSPVSENQASPAETVSEPAPLVTGVLTLEQLEKFQQTPWVNHANSIAEIQRLAARLRQFQGNCAHVRFVRELLSEAGVIDYKRRRHGNRRRPRT